MFEILASKGISFDTWLCYFYSRKNWMFFEVNASVENVQLFDNDNMEAWSTFIYEEKI